MTGTAPANPSRALLTDVRSVAGRQLRASAALTLVGVFAEGAGLLMLLPMLSILADGHGRVAERLGTILPPRLLLPAILALFLLVMAARAAILLARDRSVARLENDYDVSLRLRVAAAGPTTTLAAKPLSPPPKQWRTGTKFPASPTVTASSRSSLTGLPPPVSPSPPHSMPPSATIVR